MGLVADCRESCDYILSCQVINVISKAEIGDCSASNTDSAFMIYKGVCHDPFQKYVEEGG